jgi:hypothetical protein
MLVLTILFKVLRSKRMVVGDVFADRDPKFIGCSFKRVLGIDGHPACEVCLVLDKDELGGEIIEYSTSSVLLVRCLPSFGVRKSTRNRGLK